VGTRAAQMMTRPSSDAEVVLSVDPGTILNVIDSDGQWYWVSLPPDRNGGALRGWVQAWEVQLVTATGTLMIPPTGEEIRTLMRIEKARQDVEEKRRAYEAAVQRRAEDAGGRGVTLGNGNAAADQRLLSTPSTSRQSIGIRAFGAIDGTALTAHQSFNAVLGTSQLMAFGGGADVLNVWKSAFVRVAVSHAIKSGNRAFVLNGQPVSLGIPITVSMTPVEIGGGWRFGTFRSTRIVPYAGGGVLIQPYSEKSAFAGLGDDVSQTNTGFTAFGGVEVDVSKWLMVGAEAQFRGVPNAIGKGGVSQAFGETNLGGYALRVLFGIRH
jgi:hypothetical protein